MSTRVTEWCWQHSQAKGTDRLILICIADCANHDGLEAYPSYATIATRCGGLSVKTVQRAIPKLVSLSELGVELRGGPAYEGKTNQRPNRYSFPAYQAWLKTGQDVHPSGAKDRTRCPPFGGERPDILSRSPDILSERPDTAVSAKPSFEPSFEPSVEPTMTRVSDEAARGGGFEAGGSSGAKPQSGSRKSGSRSPKLISAAPGDFSITPSMRSWFDQQKLAPLGVDLACDTERFLDHHAAKGSKFKDWEAAWRNWMRNAGKYAQERARNGQRHAGDGRGKRRGVDVSALPAGDWRRFSEQ